MVLSTEDTMRNYLLCLGIWAYAANGLTARAQQSSCADMEQFLRAAEIGTLRAAPKGVTLPKRATLDDGTRKHDAGIQTIDERKAEFHGPHGSELNFRDFWGYNVAGYELAKLLELNMVPPYVARKVGGTSASLSWWISGVMMDEGERQRRKTEPPDPESWNKEMAVIRVFTQLIYNTDDNFTNFLITRDWRLWMIDFTRAFRTEKTLLNAKNLTRCDRRVLARMRELNKPRLEERLEPYLTGTEIAGLLARRDVIVHYFDGEIAKKGEAAILFDIPRSEEACGAGLN
jgi:hypothetical protein